MAKLSDFFKKDSQKRLVQVRLELSLFEKTKEKLNEKNLSWTDLLEAACKMFLEEK